MDVDDFIDNRKTDKYASWFLMLKRMPAAEQYKFEEFIAEYTLFCTYKDQRYRVTGASRMGDIWLTKDFKQDTGYQLRVDIDDCSVFTRTSTEPYTED